MLDHVFIASNDPTLESLLVEAGWPVTLRRRHTGQGTANAIFAFGNTYLELLFGVDTDEMRHPAVQPLGLWQRTEWASSGACPFGLCLRLSEAQRISGQVLTTWDYAPPGAPTSRKIPVVTPQGGYSEPINFLADQPASNETHQTSTANSDQRLTDLVLHLTYPIKTPAVQDCLRRLPVRIVDDGQYLMEWTIDGGQRGRVINFPAALPLMIRC